MAELEKAQPKDADRPAKKSLGSCVRHPVRSVRAYLDACSVKSAFFFYSLVGVLAALAASSLLAMAIASFSEDLLYNGSVAYPGLYIYDEEDNALVKAEDMSWYQMDDSEFTNYAENGEPIVVQGVTLYMESSLTRKGSRYVIPLDDVPKEAEGLVVHDMDERISGEEEMRDTSISLEELPAYDAAANAQRGDAAALEMQLPMDSEGERPAVSLVGYYVHFSSGAMYQMVNFSIFVVVPLVFVVCFFLASRGFYRRKLQRPIQEMDEAARRIAEGDLSVSLAAPPEGSKSELDRLCVSFETMRDALERNNKAMWRMAENRRKVNAAFAHDLRTPLTVLKGRAEMLSTFAPEGVVDADQLVEASSAMTRQAERLQRYVESMKDLVDLDECTVSPHEGNVGVWFVRAAAEASDLARGAGKDFEAKAKGLPRFISFDDLALSRVVENALSNALRYARSKVSLACEWDDGTLTVRVADDGPGFGDDALSHGCEPFWREDSEKRREDSVHFGLGLNICTELCEKHGGGVRLSNAESGGAVVEAFVKAPLVQNEEEA